MMLDNRPFLFGGADERVGPLFLWHFVEEIEHRSSAHVIYNEVGNDEWYRVRQVPKAFRHVTSVYSAIIDGMAANVPVADQGVPVQSVKPMGL